MPPELQAFDHIHVYVTDRAQAEAWYRRVLGLHRSPGLEFWATGGGPLTVQNDTGTVQIALFERPAQPCRSVVAIRVGGAQYLAWKAYLEEAMPGAVSEQDHEASMSLYFRDPDGNPYELTTYELAGSKPSAESAT
ncbi:VOC family protein [Rhodoferax sp. WC2427]|uniref:VOC family protein n=1 Tax=Rhodoferax sp. WC2427 TaxID=3234144 RepID=UPI003466E501